MSTTTIRLDHERKIRISVAAARTGNVPHAFMIDVIADTVERTEADEEFHRVADERWADFRRFLEHMHRQEVTDAPARISHIIAALQVLQTSLLIGRPVKGAKREPVIGQG
jgi:predicted transcriptional regulator